MIFPGIGARICCRPSASSAPCRRPRQARGSVTSAVNSCRPVCSVSEPVEVGVTRISNDLPLRRIEKMLGAISTLSASTTSPSSEMRHPSALLSSSTRRRVLFIETSNFMECDPIDRGGLLASSGRTHPASIAALLFFVTPRIATKRRRLQPRPLRYFLFPVRRVFFASEVDRAILYGSRREENRVRKEFGGRGRRWS